MVMSNGLLSGIKNVEFDGYEFVEEAGSEFPLFMLNETTVEEWNVKAYKANTKMFIHITGRQPKDYTEVRAWMDSNIKDLTASTVKV